MRILFLTQVLPYPLDAGPKIRACYTLRHLAQQHQVTLLSFVRPTDTPAQVEHLAQFCQAVHTVPMRRSQVRDALHLIESLITGQSFIIRRDRVPAMARRVDELLATGEFDMVHADQLWMAQYALRARTASRKPGSPIPRLVLDEHNACYLIARRLAAEERNPLKRALAMLESRKMARYEVETCRRFDRVVWVTEQDHQAVEQQASDGERRVPRSAVIPICGDPTTTPMIGRKPGAQRVTFLGGLHYPPNAQGVLWFVRHVWLLILQQIPDAVLTVIGKDPPSGIQYPISNIHQSNLEVTGYLPDPTPYLAETAAFIVPLLAGGGMRVKIVDAWMWGLPVVSTTIGAEGIETRPGENILIADTPAEFAQAVVRLLRDREAGQRIGQAGRRWAEQRYDWRTVYRAWDEVYTIPEEGFA